MIIGGGRVSCRRVLRAIVSLRAGDLPSAKQPEVEEYMEYIQLMNNIGYRFRDAKLLKKALTHSSYALQQHIQDNQRLEFLGDAVLELCVSRRIYEQHPDMKEGQLTRLRALLVRESSLAESAKRFALGDFLRLDHGEQVSGGREKPSILADTMEAVIAAVYLDGGLEAAVGLIDRALVSYDAPSEQDERDAKSALQEMLQSKGENAPQYEIICEDGPPHARIFTAQVRSQDGSILGHGKGVSKKRAEQEAAQEALEHMGKN